MAKPPARISGILLKFARSILISIENAASAQLIGMHAKNCSPPLTAWISNVCDPVQLMPLRQ